MDIPDLPLIYYPDDRLRLKADPLDATTADAAGLARALFALMYRSKGRGLAATQAGLLHRLFVINPLGDPARPDQEKVFVNPQVVVKKPRLATDEEGCLSLPGLYAPVERPRAVKVRYTDLAGKTVEAAYDGTFARIFQHELDHLDGVLFIDRVTPAVLRKIEPELATLRARFGPPSAPPA